MFAPCDHKGMASYKRTEWFIDDYYVELLINTIAHLRSTSCRWVLAFLHIDAEPKDSGRHEVVGSLWKLKWLPCARTGPVPKPVIACVTSKTV